MPLVRTITHWTGGGNRANESDLKHYHFVTEYDGTVVPGKLDPSDNIVTSDGVYAAHVRNLNAGSIGVAMAGMHGAVEHPFDAGPSPLTEKQFEAHCMLLAELHRKYGIPVGRRTCLTHAEVEPVLGVKQAGKWDVTRLPFKPELHGALTVGDYMRERVAAYVAMGEPILAKPNAPLLRKGMSGPEVRQLQEDLRSLGFFSGKVDGKFGPLTEEAVVTFQTRHGLERDGVAGPVTQSAILKAKPKPARDTNEKELKAAGSVTIDSADKATGGLVGVGGILTLDAVADVTEKAQGIVPAIGLLFRDHWPIMLAIGVLVVVWYLHKQIKAARVRAAVNGENLSK